MSNKFTYDAKSADAVKVQNSPDTLCQSCMYCKPDSYINGKLWFYGGSNAQCGKYPAYNKPFGLVDGTLHECPYYQKVK